MAADPQGPYSPEYLAQVRQQSADAVAPFIGPPPPPPKAAPPPAGGDPFGLGLGGQSQPARVNVDMSSAPPREVNGAPPETGAAPAGAMAATPEAERVMPPPRSSPAQVVPGGFYPDKMTMEAKLGKPVSESTKAEFKEGAEQKIAGEQIERDAAKELYGKQRMAAEAQMQAISDAQAHHAAVQTERNQVIRARMAEIEALNQKASAAIDPDKYWHDRGAFAQVLGAIAVGLGQFGAGLTHGENGAAKIIDAAINRDIQAQLENRKGVQDQIKNKYTLLGQHLDMLGDQDKAIEATRLAYYDAVMKQVEAYKADNGAAVSDASYNKLVGDLKTRYAETSRSIEAQEAADVTQGFSQKYHMPQAIGGGGAGGLTEQGNTVRLSDGTVAQFQNEPSRNKAADRVRTLDELQRKNSEILGLRQKAYELDPLLDMAEYKTVEKQLNDLQQRKMEVVSIAAGQGILRKEDVEREEKYGISATSGLGQVAGRIPVYSSAERAATDAALRRQSQRYGEDQKAAVSVEGGHLVRPGYVADPTTGELRPVTRYVGKDVSPQEHLPPSSFKPMKAGQKTYNAPERSLEQETPKAPYFGEQAAAKGAHKRGKKEKED